MTRLVIALALGAVVTVLAGSGTQAAFTQTQTNAATMQTQAVFPPLNTSAPTATVTVPGVTLTGAIGTWTTVNVATSTYTMQWQRCSGGACADSGGSLTLDASNLLGTLTYTITGADAGSTLRLKVTGVDSSIAAPDRASTVAYSPGVSP